MKKLILAIIFMFMASSAGAVDLAWDKNTDSATGYILYYQKTGSDTIYSEIVSPPGKETVSFTVDNAKFDPGAEQSFWLTAYNTLAESGPSNIVIWTAPIFIPTDNPAPIIINIPSEAGPVTINVQ